MKNNVIGQKVRALRLHRGLSQRELGLKLGVTQYHVSRLELGQEGWRSEMIIKVAGALGIPPSHLFLEGEGASIEDVFSELDSAGLVPSKALTKALTAPEFLEFMEQCAKAVRGRSRNLGRMEDAVRRIR